MDDAVDDDGVAPRAGVKLGVGRQLEDAVGFVQADERADADAQETVARGVAPPGEHLMEIHLAHPRAARQLRLGKTRALVQLRQRRADAGGGKAVGVLFEIGFQVRLAHQLLPQVGGGFFHGHAAHAPLLFVGIHI